MYGAFPDDDGKVAARLMSGEDSDHYQAVDELVTHSRLRETYDDVRYEEGGIGPDFRVYEEGVLLGTVEVLSMFMRKEWTQVQRRFAALADDIDGRLRPNAGYMVDIDTRKLTRSVSGRKVAEFIVDEMAKLPPHTEHPTSRPSTVRFSDGNDVEIEIRFFPLREGAPAITDPDAPIVAMGPRIGGAINTIERLRSTLHDKAGNKYDVAAQAPFMVAVGMHEPFFTVTSLVCAAHGDEQIAIPSGEFSRANNGFFGVSADGIARNRRVSAVTVLEGMLFGPQEWPRYLMVDNPFALHEPIDLLRADHRLVARLEDGEPVGVDWEPAAP